MNDKEIRKALINGTLRENEQIEFKANLPMANPEALAKTMVSLANTKGGWLIIGIREEKDGFKAVGVRESKNSIRNMIEIIVNKYTTGIEYDISWDDDFVGINIALINIKENLSTAFYSRRETSPEREISYVRTEKGSLKTIAKHSYKYVYKYMTVESFLSSLYNESWRFFEPSKWADRYEQRFYLANYKIPAAKGNTPQLFATCVTRAKNSEAAWKVYSHGQGLGAHCLQLKLDVSIVRNEIRKSKLMFHERTVDYKDESYILNLHRPGKTGYDSYFKNFNFNNFLSLLSLKREAYSYEKEVRLFVIPDMKINVHNSYKNVQPMDIKVSWKDIILDARVDKNCSAAELKAIQQACYSAGINPNFGKASIMPGGAACPAVANPIDFVLFDIDDMPGRRITIK